MKRLLTIALFAATALLSSCSRTEYLSCNEMRPIPGRKHESCGFRDYEVTRVNSRKHPPSICVEDSSIKLRDAAGKRLIFTYDSHIFPAGKSIRPGMKARACLNAEGKVIYLNFITRQSI